MIEAKLRAWSREHRRGRGRPPLDLDKARQEVKAAYDTLKKAHAEGQAGHEDHPATPTRLETAETMGVSRSQLKRYQPTWPPL